jgi:hypothetical protein
MRPKSPEERPSRVHSQQGRNDPAASSASNARNEQSQLQRRAGMTSYPSHDSYNDKLSVTGTIRPSLDYLVPWENIEIEGHYIKEDMKQYIQWLANQHQLHFQRSTVLEYDAACDRCLPPGDHVFRYYILHSSAMDIASVPAPTRENKVMFFAHATTEGGLRGILKDRCILPMKAHNVPGCAVFYALGHELWGEEHDLQNIARVLHNAWRLAKNSSKLLVVGRAWGTLSRQEGGSFATASVASQRGDTMKDKNSNAYCVHTSCYTMRGLAFSVQGDPPKFPI